MKTATRRHLHVIASGIWLVAYFVMLALQVFWPATFELIWRQVLLFVSFYALSATHLSGASAETPTHEGEES